MLRSDTINILGENIGAYPCDPKVSHVFVDLIPKARVRKAKIDSRVYIKLTVKEVIIKFQRQPAKWEKIPANHVSVKRLISKMYKEVMQLNNKKSNGLKMGRGSE